MSSLKTRLFRISIQILSTSPALEGRCRHKKFSSYLSFTPHLSLRLGRKDFYAKVNYQKKNYFILLNNLPVFFYYIILGDPIKECQESYNRRSSESCCQYENKIRSASTVFDYTIGNELRQYVYFFFTILSLSFRSLHPGNVCIFLSRST